jgi:hypothetical protein
MDVAVLLLFALFFTVLLIATLTRYDVLRATIRRPRVFQLAAVGAVAVTVPVDVYALVYNAAGPSGTTLADVSARLVLMNVAAACGVAALHGSLRHAMRMGVLGWIGPLVALVVVTVVVALGNQTSPGAVGPSAGGVDDVLAVYSLLVCLISASSLFRGRARRAIDPREG